MQVTVKTAHRSLPRTLGCSVNNGPTDIKYPLERQNEWGLSNVYPLVNAGVFTILRETENSSSEDAAELQIRGVEFYPSGSV